MCCMFVWYMLVLTVCNVLVYVAHYVCERYAVNRVCGDYMSVHVLCESGKGWGWRRAQGTIKTAVEGQGLGG